LDWISCFDAKRNKDREAETGDLDPARRIQIVTGEAVDAAAPHKRFGSSRRKGEDRDS
jgi:hypothetical protein